MLRIFLVRRARALVAALTGTAGAFAVTAFAPAPAGAVRTPLVVESPGDASGTDSCPVRVTNSWLGQ